MMAWLSIWWVWLALALVLAIVELLLPGFIFLGIAIAAAIVSLLLLALPDMIGGLGFNVMMALFAGLSLASWILLLRLFRKQSSGAEIFTKDIND